MAVVNNTLSEIGDVLIIEAELPMVGVSALSSFVDDVLGVTGSRTFTKEFSYSVDGINFSEWITLSNPNLTALSLNKKNIFNVKFKYTRSGTDNSGILTFNSVDLVGTFEEIDCGIIFNQSVFSYFFDSCNATPILEWAVNVLEKLYRTGIVPSYIERGGSNNEGGEDRDYIDFWTAVTMFFGLLVSYVRKFEDFVGDEELSRKYLRNRGMIVCDNNELDDITYLMQNFWDEIRQRGTYMIGQKKGDVVNGEEKQVDGELLRLMCYDKYSCDEFLFSMSLQNKIGWNVGNWSPLWKGISDQDQLTKAYETGESVVSLDSYPLIESSYITKVTDGDVDVINITGIPASSESGIGSTAPIDDDHKITVSPHMDYQLSFYFNQIDAGASLSVKIYGYDIDDNIVSMRDVSLPSLPAKDVMLEKYENGVLDEYYFLSFNLYSHEHLYVNDDHVNIPNVGTGNNLKMPPNVCYIVPEIVLYNTTGGASGTIRLYNVKFRPLKTEYSTGFIGLSDFVQVWGVNRNTTQSVEKIEDFTKRNLINYGSSLKINYL